MQIKILKKDDISEKLKTRSLYEKNFDIGDIDYIDYYYEVIIKRNEIVVLLDNSDNIISMVHLNPYLYNILGDEQLVHYFVAIATETKYRKMGYMNKVLSVAFDYLYSLREPFCFTMPIDSNIKKIYEKQGFDVICPFNINKFSNEKYDIFPIRNDEFEMLMRNEQKFLDKETDEYILSLSKKEIMFKILYSNNIKSLDDLRNKNIYVCQEV